MKIDLDLGAARRPKFNPEKHYLGTLCNRLHDAGDGRSWRHRGHGNCVECTREGARKWKNANPERSKANIARRDSKRNLSQYRGVYRISSATGSAKGRAKLLNVPYDITPDDMRTLWEMQKGLCFWTDKPLTFDYGDRHPLKASIDRIIPAEGYVCGNVVWATSFANRARNDLSFSEFHDIMKEMGFTGRYLTRRIPFP